MTPEKKAGVRVVASAASYNNGHEQTNLHDTH